MLKNILLESKSPAFQAMLNQCRRVARSKVNVLLIGESGSGKEIAAKYIHAGSPRFNNEFVAVSCAALSEALLESEIFGHEQGAFTGAVRAKPGKFEVANGGTLFLDEVGELGPRTQAKLLRVLETKSTERLGSVKNTPIDFRLISATNKDLRHEIIREFYREDFFYRISSIVIKVPALRERMEDLKQLIDYFLLQSQAENGIAVTGMDPDVRKFLYSYDYPGNIRELKSIVNRMVVLSSEGVITKEGIPVLYNMSKGPEKPCTKFSSGIIPFKQFKQQAESEYLQRVLDETGGNVTHAAEQLLISPRHLFARIKAYGLQTRNRSPHDHEAHEKREN